MNSLALSVGERTQEIGTMRALGANQWVVAQVIGGETLLVVLASSLVGLGVGTLGLFFINLAHFEISNPVLVSWLGSSRLQMTFSAPLWGEHILLALVLSLAACWLPVTRAVSISPLQAMNQE
jgi:putative ABC transport system permease protein